MPSHVSETDNPTLVFVYGTLMRGECRHQFLSDQKFLGEAQTLPLYRLVNCGTYPGLLESPSGGEAIRGEVWSVSSGCRTILDEVEGVEEQLYEPRPIQLADPFSSSAALAYFYLPDTAELPPLGPDWRTYRPD